MSFTWAQRGIPSLSSFAHIWINNMSVMQFPFDSFLHCFALLSKEIVTREQVQEHNSPEINCSSGLNLAAAEVGIQ